MWEGKSVMETPEMRNFNWKGLVSFRVYFHQFTAARDSSCLLKRNGKDKEYLLMAIPKGNNTEKFSWNDAFESFSKLHNKLVESCTYFPPTSSVTYIRNLYDQEGVIGTYGSLRCGQYIAITEAFCYGILSPMETSPTDLHPCQHQKLRLLLTKEETMRGIAINIYAPHSKMQLAPKRAFPSDEIVCSFFSQQASCLTNSLMLKRPTANSRGCYGRNWTFDGRAKSRRRISSIMLVWTVDHVTSGKKYDRRKDKRLIVI
ncbi:hypothetical protein Tco_0199436 [Tanacetum coccineum]